jgi:transposase
MTAMETIRHKFALLEPALDERRRRLWAAAEALAQGHGGIGVVAQATGLARATISNGCRELRAGTQTPAAPAALTPGRVRRQGGGRKPLTHHDPDLVAALDALVDPLARGDPESPLRWTTKSTYQLAATLQAQGHRIGPWKVGQILRDRGYSLQRTRKTKEGRQHPDRDAQFEHINAQAEQFQARGQPVVSVDTKKKELVGNFANGGREWQACGCPEEVRVHDFPDPDLGKAIPYGVYDLAANQGWVSVGTDHDTAAFAVATVGQWWEQMGQERYPAASELLITADGGGSNGYRVRLWKVALQALAEATGLTIRVCHFPPGTSKWNKIEHRMFSAITKNWRGRPLESHEAIVSLIGETRTQSGLSIRAELDENQYPTGIKVSPAELAQVQLEPAAFHGEWNYTIRPRACRND